MKRNLKSLNFLVIGLYVFGNTLYANTSALETKCGTSEKNALISSLQQQRSSLQTTQPQKAQQVDRCIQSIYGAYAACVNTLNSAGATAIGAGTTNQMGQMQQFQAQQNTANGASQLSMQDKALNDACVQQYASAQKSCTGFPSSASAQSYTSKVQGLCAMDAQQAASNADNFNQIEDAAQQLTPPTSPQSPTASPNNSTPPPSSGSPSSAGSGYTTPSDLAGTSPDFAFPNTLNSPSNGRDLASVNSKTEKEPDNRSLPGYNNITEKGFDLAAKENSDAFLKEDKSGAGASPLGSTSGILASSSGNSESPSTGEKANKESGDTSEAAIGAESGSVGGGLAFAPSLGMPFDITSGPGLQKLLENAQNPNAPLVEKIVPVSALPTKAMYGAKKSNLKTSTKERIGIISSLFKNKKPNKARRAPGNIETEKAPDNESENMSRPLALLLLLMLTAGTGQLYKKLLRV